MVMGNNYCRTYEAALQLVPITIVKKWDFLYTANLLARINVPIDE